MGNLDADAVRVPAAATEHAVAEEPEPAVPSPENPHGLTVSPVFCPAEVEDPLDTVEWEVRTATIQGEKGEVIFEQEGCEIPASWSQLATNVVVSKYFYGEVGTSEREVSVRQLIHRVTRTIADWGVEDGYFASPADGERFYRELTWLCLHQHAAFNSPVWFNVGLYSQYGIEGASCNWRWDSKTRTVGQPENPYEYPQGSACFIQSVQDNMEDIMELARSEAMLFKFGSGTGTDLSTLRSHREKLSGGGKPSGPGRGTSGRRPRWAQPGCAGSASGGRHGRPVPSAIGGHSAASPSGKPRLAGRTRRSRRSPRPSSRQCSGRPCRCSPNCQIPPGMEATHMPNRSG
jgi:hypothetical protein